MNVKGTIETIKLTLNEAQLLISSQRLGDVRANINQALGMLKLLSEQYDKQKPTIESLPEVKELAELIQKLREERAETNRLLTEILSKRQTEEHELTKALNLLHE